jgi:diguanylate cyclase (GGDEF)-like protein/PAS domain S-box-containing protein
MVPFLAAAAILSVAATIIAIALFDLLSAGRAYVAGESQWSKAQQAAVFHLDRYAESGDRSQLEAARRQLEVPLSDRRARLALLRGPSSADEARAALEQGRNHVDDIPGMVRLFQTFRSLPHFAEALELWREADVWLLRLEQLADELEQLDGDRGNKREQINSIRSELDLLNQSMLAQAIRFSDTIADGARSLSRTATVLSVASILLFTVLLIGVFLWAVRGMRRSQLRFWATFERAPVGMSLVDADGRIGEINDALCNFLERSAESLPGELLTRFADPRDRSSLQQALEEEALGRNPGQHRLEARFIRPDRSVAWGKLSISSHDRTRDGHPSTIVVIEDISETRSLSAELAYQAAHDQLTGLANRREFERSLNQLLRENRLASQRHAVCLIDLDQFKLINDTFGHLAGDAVLVRLAERIHHCLRDGDLLARLDGDEFGVIMRNCGIETAARIAGRLRDTVSTFEFRWEERPIQMSASIGVIEINHATQDAARLMQQVDLLCYEAKEQGRNQVRVQADAGASSLRRQQEMDWVHRIKEAIAEERLRFHGQLIAPTIGDDWRCELLVRLEDRDGRLYTAGTFMEAAERFHVARMIDQWVVRNALEQIPALVQQYPQIVSWHINLSAQSVNCNSVLPELLAALTRAALPPGTICFEITESAAMHSIDEAREFFLALREAGCEIALDDFGKGLSTFDYLKQLPVDLVKIDGGFVRELAHSELDHAMVRSIHEIARIAGMRTVAESVESIELILRLKQIGVDMLQGHAIHNPTGLGQLQLPAAKDMPAQLDTY